MTSKKKILILSTDHIWYDTRIYYKIVKSLLKLEVTVHLITACSSEQVNIDIESHFSYEIIPHTHKLQMLKYMYDRGKSISPDIVICIEPFTLLAGYFLQKKSHCRMVYDCHEFYAEAYAERHPRLSRLYRFLERFLARRADAIITVNDILVEYFQRVNKQTYLCANFPLRKYTEGSLTGVEKKYDAVYVGSLTLERGLSLYLDIARLFKESQRSFSLLIIGDFKNAVTEEFFWDFISKNGMDGYITYQPYLPYERALKEIRQCRVGVFCADTTVSPRYHKGINIKIFDYMTQALPIVINKLDMLSDYITKAQCGWIVPYDSQQIYQILCEILADEDLLLQRGSNGLHYLTQHNIWEMQEPALYEAALGVRS